jgi:acetyl-CoA synthetase (ADP-forming)
MSIKRHIPKTKILGVLTVRMAPPGLETIVGLKRDKVFGEVAMFGIGGIHVEVYKDVSFRVAPISRKEAYAMLSDVRASSLLEGFRGGKPVDRSAIVDALQNLNRMAGHHRVIESTEINPLTVYQKGALALDAKVSLKFTE